MSVRVLALASGTTTLESHRLGLTSFTHSAGPITGRSGIYPANGAAALATVSAMVCSIAPFNAWIDGTNTSTQGGYSFCLDASTNITFDAGNASTARVDRVIARVKDNPYDGSGATSGEVAYLKGNTTTGAATALPANSLLLYEVTVPAGTTAGGGGINFNTATADKRTYTAAAGGLIPIGSTTDRTAISNPYEGMTIWRTDKDWVERYDGSNWKVYPGAIVASASALTDITSPTTGGIAVAADTGVIYRYNGSAWKFAVPYRVVNSIGSSTATTSFTVPSGANQIKVSWRANTTNATPSGLALRVNGSATAAYFGIITRVTNATAANSNFANTSYAIIGDCSQSGAFDGIGYVEFTGWANTTWTHKTWMSRGFTYPSAGSSMLVTAGGMYSGSAPHTSLQFFFEFGNIAAGSEFVMECWDLP